MTIEEAHEILSNGLVNAPSEHEWCVAFKMAIDNMHKYQKIKQIIRNYDTAWEFHTLRGTVDKIREVVEDCDSTT